jgi:hypothetical protein
MTRKIVLLGLMATLMQLTPGWGIGDEDDVNPPRHVIRRQGPFILNPENMHLIAGRNVTLEVQGDLHIEGRIIAGEGLRLHASDILIIRGELITLPGNR